MRFILLLLQLRRQGVRLFLVWYQILQDNASDECHRIFTLLVPGLGEGDLGEMFTKNLNTPDSELIPALSLSLCAPFLFLSLFIPFTNNPLFSCFFWKFVFLLKHLGDCIFEKWVGPRVLSFSLCFLTPLFFLSVSLWYPLQSLLCSLKKNCWCIFWAVNWASPFSLNSCSSPFLFLTSQSWWWSIKKKLLGFHFWGGNCSVDLLVLFST